MPRIHIEDLDVHYQQAGAGPDVVLVHAFTSNLAVWMLTNILHVLGQRFRVTLYDLRGHGLTTATRRGYTSAQLAADLRALQQQLSLEPCLVVGHSYGGVIGMHAARLFPESFTGIVVCDSYFPGLAELEPTMPHAQPWRDLRQSFLKANIDLGETVDFARLFREVAALQSAQRQTLDSALGPAASRWLSQMSQLAATEAGTEAFEVAGLTSEEICRVEQPITALYDEHTPFQATRDFLGQHLADCHVDVVPHAKHLAPVENSKEFVQKVHCHLCRMAGRDNSA